MIIKRCLPSLVKRLVLLFMGFSISGLAWAGNPPTAGLDEVIITVKSSETNVAESFGLIQQQSSLVFAYDETEIDVTKKLVLTPGQQSVRALLQTISQQALLSFIKRQNTILVSRKDPGSTAPAINVVDAISGNVKDAAGANLEGATVMVKGTTQSVITDAQGNFSIEAAPDAVLTISMVGYKAQDVPVNGRNFIQVQLEEANRNLNEVVVVGYQTQKRSTISGAVSVVNVAGLTKLPVATVEEALQGKVSGVRITQATGQPGEGVAIRIRGVGTINDNNPLFIVDGVPTKEGINFLSPSDIESITVLKDAASSAIYGARSSNGVVLVTTKSGKKGRPQFSYNTYGGIQTHGHLPKMSNTQQYVELYNEAADNDNFGVTNPALIRAKIPQGLATANTDWMDAIFQNGKIQSHQLSVRGGTDKTLYYLSGNYFKQDGIILNSSYERSSLLSKLNIDLTDRLSIAYNMTVSYAKRNIIGSSGDGYAGNGGSVVRYALFRTPAIPVKDSLGQYTDLPAYPNFFGDGYNPVALAEKTDNKQNIFRVFSNFYFTYKILKDLRFKSDIGVDASATNSKRFDENYGTNLRINNPNRLAVSTLNSTNVIWNNTLNYNRTLKEIHEIGVLIGTEAITNRGHFHEGTDKGFADQSPRFRYIGNGDKQIGSTTSTESKSESALFSLFASANYSYKNMIAITGNVRRDGSSRFGPDNKYGTFYSGSLSWNAHKMRWVENNLGMFSTIKFRASYGKLGNQEIPDNGYVSIIGNGYNYPFGTTPVSNPGSTISTLGNPKVKWESSTQADIGLDLGVMNEKFTLAIDYFNKRTSDMLIPIPFPLIGGSAKPPYLNSGKVENKGIETELVYRYAKKNLKFDLGANFSFIKNKVLSLSTGQPIAGGRIDNNYNATLTRVGESIGSFYLLEQEGIFQNEADVFASAFQGLGIKPGDVKFKDQNQDGLINEEDRVFLGSAIPKFTYGFTGNVSYKNFDLSIFFQGQQGNKIYSQVNMDIEGFYRAFNVTERVYEGRWRGEGTSNTIPRVSFNGASNNKYPSSRFLEDGSYLRLKNAQIGYTIQANILKRYRVKSLRIYVSGQNLWTATKYSGLDPEMHISDNVKRDVYGGDVGAGIDWGTYPSARTYIIGLNLNF